MNLTATHINYYMVCHRKLWLFSNGINMEHTSDVVYDGKLLHENSYLQRADKYTEIVVSAKVLDDSVQLSGKIDFYDVKHGVIHEIKRSNKVDSAHKWQVKFYIWLLELNGVHNVYGVLEYPKIRQKEEVRLSESDRSYLKKLTQEIPILIKDEVCPPKINAKICKSCSYFDFCYVHEEDL